MKYLYSAAIIAFSIIIFASMARADGVVFSLTEKERVWIEEHPEITVANETDWPPFDYTENSQPAGYSIDVVRLIARKTGLQVNFINGYSWKELMQQFKQGKIDLLPALFINQERQKFISFTHSYHSQPSVMVVHKDNKDIRQIENLKNKRVAGVEGYSFTRSIKKIIPSATMLPVNSILEGLKTVSLGKADAFVDSIGTVSYLLENNYIPNLKIISDIKHEDLDSPAIYMGVAKENSILKSILNKAIASINRDEKRELAKTWFHQSEKKTFVLSPVHQQWLQQHPKIRIGIMNAWPPMNYIDANGKPRGIGVRYIDALNKRFDNRFEIIPGLWKDNFSAVKERRLDALMDITPRPDREAFVHFTRPYIEVPHLIYTRKGESPMKALSDLAGKTVGIEKGFFIVKVLKEKYPTVRVNEYKTTSDALDAVSKGEVDAYVGNRAVANYITENELINNVIAQGKIKETSSINAIGVRKDWEMLRDILQVALDDIGPAERSNIINTNPKQNHKQLREMKSRLYEKLSHAERDWLNKKVNIRLGVDAAWPPIEWIDKDGAYQGMSSEYIKVIAEMAGLNLVQPEKLAWKDILNGAKEKTIDLITAVVDIPKRGGFLEFTTPYMKFPFVIFTRDDAELITGLSDFYGKRVGIEAGYSSQEELQRDHPQLDLVPYNTTRDILYALSVGEIDAYVGNLTVAVYLLKKEGLTNIRVAAPTTYDFELSFGVRKDWPELRSILEKSLSLINEEQRNEIRQRWLKLHFNVGLDYSLVIKVAIIISGIMLLTFLWLFFVQRQKRLLRIAKDETDQANAKLKELNQLKSMFIASVSHELRTPLNAVIGFSSIMMNGLSGQLNDEYQDYAIRINKSGQHLLSLITDIIDISKIESGNLDTEISEFKLDEVIEESIINLQQLADSKHLQIISNVAKEIILHTDKRRLFQCILNIVSNAIKYTEKGEVIVSVEDAADRVRIIVKDTGVGIKEEDMEQLFQPFERFESHISVKAGGTGLGLYLTNKIVTDMLKGEIGAESKIGEGSLFWINIPKVI